MTEPTTQGASTPKKKTSPWIWVLIGCLGLLIVMGGGCAILGFFAARKAQEVIGDVAEDFEKNPAMAAAEMVVKLNPELELVESDPDAETLTIRNKETGEVVTLNLADVQEGRISFEGGGQEVTVGMTGGEEGPVGIEITGGEEESTFQMGPGAGDGDWPDWIEVYPGSTPEGTYSARAGEQWSGAFSMKTGDTVAEVLEFYEQALGDAGFEVQTSTFSGPEGEGGSVSGRIGTPERSVGVVVNRPQGEPTNIAVTFSEEG